MLQNRMHLVSKSGSYRNGGVVHPACPEASSVHAPAPAVATFPSSVGGLSRTVSVGDRYRRRQTIGLGIVQATIGALCIVFNAVSLGFHDTLILQRTSVSFVGHGFWIGMLFIVTGTLGLAAGKRRTRCTITAFMTMCIVSATFTSVLLLLGVAGAVVASQGDGYSSCVESGRGSSYGFSYYYPYHYLPPCRTFPVVVAMEACMAVAGFFEAIVAIWGAVICCQSRVCCCSGPPHAMGLPASSYPNNGQVVYLPQAHEEPHVVYAPTHGMSYSQGSLIAPLSHQTQTSYSQTVWCSRPHQKSVAGGIDIGTHIPPNSPPPPYSSNTHSCQPKDFQQKY